MSRSDNKKTSTDNRSTIVKGFIKPTNPTFSGNKFSSNFKPNARLGTINRGRR